MPGDKATIVVHLRCVDPANNKNRFYAVSLRRTLFGDWSVVREWGRIGSRGGQRCENWFADLDEARSFMGALEKAKKQRGYREII